MAKEKIRVGMLAMVLVFGMMVVGCGNDSKFVGTWVNKSGREIFQLYPNGSGKLFQSSGRMGISSSYDEDYIYINWQSRKNDLVILNEDYGLGMSFKLSDSTLTQLDGSNSGRILTKKE
jgi:hypothetical protein